MSEPNPNVVETCRQELITYYLDYIDKITLLPGDFYHSVHISRIYTSLELLNEGTAAARNQQTLRNHGDLLTLRTAHDRQIKRVMIRGDPGTGKTTAMKKLTFDWADTRDKMTRGVKTETNNPYQYYELLFFLRLGELENNFDLIDAIFDQLLPLDTEVERESLSNYIKKHGDKVCVICDGVDEISRDQIQDETCGNIIHMLHNRAMRKCFVLATTRPWNLQDLGRARPLYTHAQMAGFTDENIEIYVKRYFEGSGKEKRAQELLDNLHGSAAKKELARNPMVLLMMCLLWENKKDVPDTITRLYETAMIYMIDRLAIDKKDDEPEVDDDLAEGQLAQLTKVLGPVALNGLLHTNGKIAFRDTDFPTERRSFVLGEACEIGVITKDQIKSGLKIYYRISFFHKTFQEFIAARYWKSLVQDDFESYLSLIKTLDDAKAAEFLLLFCCGDNRPCAERILQHVLHLPLPTQSEEEITAPNTPDISNGSATDHAWQRKSLLLRCYQETQSGHFCSLNLQDVFFRDQRLVCESSSCNESETEMLASIAYLMETYCQCQTGCKLYTRQVLINVPLTTSSEKQVLKILQHLKLLRTIETISIVFKKDVGVNSSQNELKAFLSALSKLTNLQNIILVMDETRAVVPHHRVSVDAIIRCLRNLQQLHTMTITGVSFEGDKKDLWKVAREHPSLLNFRLNEFVLTRYLSNEEFKIREEGNTVFTPEYEQHAIVQKLPDLLPKEPVSNETPVDARQTHISSKESREQSPDHSTTRTDKSQCVDVVPDFAGLYTNHRMQRANPTLEQLNLRWCYDMIGSVKGPAFIVNIDKFGGEATERKGSEIDLINIRHLCTELGYEVEEHKNLTAQDILAKMKSLVDRCNQPGTNFKSSIIVLMSHGSKGYILGTDNRKVTMEDIQTLFDEENCPGLVNKPKLYFIQACRGNKRSVSSGSTGSVSDPEYPDVTADAPPDMPPIDDMHFAYACPEGYMSLRSETDGSWFVQALCEVFYAWAHKDSLPELMSKVTERVTRVKGRLAEQDILVKQTPECVTRLRKTFYFLPGYSPPS